MSTALDDAAEIDVDLTIRRTVRALRGARESDARALAAHLGISRQSFYNRLNGAAPFLAAEIARLAQFFGVPITDFYEGIVRVTPMPDLNDETDPAIRRKARLSQRHLHPVPDPAGDHRPSSETDEPHVAQVRVA